MASLCIWLIGCNSSQRSESHTQAQPASPPQQSQPARYDLKGKVVGVDKAGKTVAVAGEDIPGFMAAMTMSYPVKNEKLLEGLSPGDQITAKVVAQGSEYWLENIAVSGDKQQK
jgi:Cu/Ag efflux protein CusF